MKTEGQENTLNDFTGFSAESFDFFGENSKGTSIDSDNLLEAVRKDNPVIIPSKEKDDEIIDADNDDNAAVVFDWEATEDEDTDPEEESDYKDTNKGTNTATPKKDKTVAINSKSTLDFLKNKGFLDYELPEGKTELTDIEADDLLEDSWENSLDAAIAETVEGLPPIAKAILQVAKNGGDVVSMIKNLSTNLSVGIDKSTDMTQEANQVLAMNIDLKEQGFDDEYISTHIETLKTTGKLETIAKKSSDRIVAKQEATESAAQEASKNAAIKNRENQRIYKTKLVDHLGENTVIEGVSVNKKEVNSIASYIADPTVLLENGSTVSELQKDLFAAMSDKNNLFLLYKMLKGKDGKLDFSFITNKAVTNFSNEVRNNIQNTEDVPVTRSSSGSSRKRSLADHF